MAEDLIVERTKHLFTIWFHFRNVYPSSALCNQHNKPKSPQEEAHADKDSPLAKLSISGFIDRAVNNWERTSHPTEEQRKKEAEVIVTHSSSAHMASWTDAYGQQKKYLFFIIM